MSRWPRLRAPCVPHPSCGPATTLPRHTGNVWLVSARLILSTARARGGQAPLASRMGTPCPPPNCSRATAFSLVASDAWLVSRRNVTALYSVHPAATSSTETRSPAAVHGALETEKVVLEAAVAVPRIRVAALADLDVVAKLPGPTNRWELAMVSWDAASSAAVGQPRHVALDAAVGVAVG